MTPRVSIGMPVFNGADYLRMALESILDQTFTDMEVVISDNASTDDTQAICEEFAARDPRILYSRNLVNQGAQPNFNRVLELSRGEYFKWASHNDWISPRYLEKCVAAADKDPSVVLVYGQMCRVDAQLNTRVMILEPSPIVRSSSAARRFHDSLWQLPYHPIFGLFRSSALRETEGLPNKPEPDRVLLAEIAMKGRFAQVPDVTLFQTSSDRKDTWTWQNRDNKKQPFVNTFRSTEALRTVMMSSPSVSSVGKALLLADLVVFQVASRVRGKIRQYRRRLRLGYGRGEQLDPGSVEREIARLIELDRQTG